MLHSVDRFVVRREVLERTESALRGAGEQGCELFALWSGTISDRIFLGTTVHIPEQKAYRLPDGLLVKVEGPALHRLNVWLYEHDETLGVQVHAHPTHAFHSTTDDTYPIVTETGSLSIVAPYFAKDGVLSRGTACYRLSARGFRRIRHPRRVITVG
jgi:hypothetical protein